MITAKQARDLQLTSDASIARILEQVGCKIKQAAELGKDFIFLDRALPYSPCFAMKDVGYDPALSPEQQLYASQLTSLGYNVKVVSETNRGGGLGCTDDNPLDVTSWHIRVSW